MVYIPPSWSRPNRITLPCRKSTCASRKALEIFDDRIFQNATDETQLTTPTKSLRAFKSAQSLSAPENTLRRGKTMNDLSGVAKPSHVEGKQVQSLLSSPEKSGPRKPPLPAKSLRRHKTVHDLRSSNRVHGTLETSKDLPSTPKKSKPHHRALDTQSNAAPLASLTNKTSTFAFSHLPIELPMESVSNNKASDPEAENHDMKLTVGSQTEAHQIPGYIHIPDTKPTQITESKAHDDEMIRTQDTCSVELRNVNDSLWCPDDFLKPMTRSDVEARRDIYEPVKRIDVTTWWQDLSPANAEDLFHIHTIFQDALKSILANDLRDMASTVQRNFLQRKGDFAHLDGFRVAIADRWIVVDREQLIHVITERAYDYFSEKQFQPNRSALLQLYLSSTECFLDWSRSAEQSKSLATGVAIRTFYDQLSKFETPTAFAGSFWDYVKFLDLNPTPREDQELVLIPQYNRDGIFVQTRYPENVEYTMENPISWLTWDDEVKGFRGRVPVYSAFPENAEFAQELRESDYAISHILEVTIHAVFTKYCTTGPAHFVRRVRTRLTIGVLPKIPSSAKNSVYGIEHQHPAPGSPPFRGSRPVVTAFDENSYKQHKPLHRESSGSHTSTLNRKTQSRHTPHDVSVPKCPSGCLHSTWKAISLNDKSSSPFLPWGVGLTAFPPQHYIPPATVIGTSQASAPHSTTCSEHESLSEFRNSYDFLPRRFRPTRLLKDSCQRQVQTSERKLAKKTEERKLLQNASGPLALANVSTDSHVISEAYNKPASTDDSRAASGPEDHAASSSSAMFSYARDLADTNELVGELSEGHDKRRRAESPVIEASPSELTEQSQKTVWLQDIDPNKHLMCGDSSGSEFEERYRTPHRLLLRPPKSVDPKYNSQAAHSKGKMDHQYARIDSRGVTNLPATASDKKPEQILESRMESLFSGGKPGDTIIFQEILANYAAPSDRRGSLSLLSSNASVVSPDKAQTKDHDLGSGIRRMKLTMPGTAAPTSQRENEGKDLATTSASKMLIRRQQAKQSYLEPDDNVASRGFSSTTKASSEDVGAGAIKAMMNSLNIEKNGSINDNSACMMPLDGPQLSAVDSEVKRYVDINMGTLWSRQERNSKRRKPRSVEERLGLEEEIALQEALKRSREEQLQRKMVAQEFDASFEDVFDDDSADDSFANDSGMKSIEVISEVLLEGGVEVKAKNDGNDTEVLNDGRWKKNEIWECIEDLDSNSVYNPQKLEGTTWCKEVEEVYARDLPIKFQAQETGHSSNNATCKSIDDDDEEI